MVQWDRSTPEDGAEKLRKMVEDALAECGHPLEAVERVVERIADEMRLDPAFARAVLEAADPSVLLAGMNELQKEIEQHIARQTGEQRQGDQT